jgi:hypothetical protein
VIGSVKVIINVNFAVNTPPYFEVEPPHRIKVNVSKALRRSEYSSVLIDD